MDNIQEIKIIFLKVFTSPPWNDEWKTDNDVDMYLQELIKNTNSLTLGYYHQSKLIGISLGYIFHWWTGNEYFIKEFCIDQDYQNKGFGSDFLNQIEAYLSNHMIRAYWLTTEKNYPAHHFYLKNGLSELNDIVFLAKSISKRKTDKD